MYWQRTNILLPGPVALTFVFLSNFSKNNKLFFKHVSICIFRDFILTGIHLSSFTYYCSLHETNLIACSIYNSNLFNYMIVLSTVYMYCLYVTCLKIYVYRYCHIHIMHSISNMYLRI